MRILMFYHSLVSDWNHGNAHFLRGIVTELTARGHEVTVMEPEEGWSRKNLLAEHGHKPIRKFQAAYPGLESLTYNLSTFNLEEVVAGADLVIVHEWSDPALVTRLGEHRKTDQNFRLLFHDTHHRMVTAPESMSALNLSEYDGVLAYGEVLRELYETSGRVKRAWTWHEAADVRLFHPRDEVKCELDLVWVGNWGDNERAEELQEFLIGPVANLKLRARVYGVRYPEEAVQELGGAGIAYAGWLPNFEVPKAFAQARLTVHIPRRPYVKALPGIPTIRIFEALACGIPLICSPWEDTENLFRPGTDFLIAHNGREMEGLMRMLLEDHDQAAEIAAKGLQTIRARHTCGHRVDELLKIYDSLGTPRHGEQTICQTA